MRCPYCGSEDSKVVDSRDVEDSIRRRRQCLKAGCAGRFTTYERVQAVALYIVKKDGRREEFSRPKLLSGLRRACEKRPLAARDIEQLAGDIEAALYAAGTAEVPSSTVGELVMERLRAVDAVAYVRFASVYREFGDIDAFRALLDAVASGERPGAAQLPLLDGAEFAPPSIRLQPAAPDQRTRNRRPVRPVQSPVSLAGEAASREQARARRKA
ncbi:MAG: transcriptional repressor NrdR [Dehalococcoidia bacterium]|nr:transcriptional repressor NrdR [Dehalococcoidia bacterium]